ncbi:MAG: NYN domain-containing protein [Bacteroidetes bacterium]|nr:NYN domain-containing protein [Bacteroidota bacterium]MBU2586400.1 NYN domain-containing protein [Bacteroidota bacterium]
MDNKKRIIFYIDGFNLYFDLRSKRWEKYYWLDLVKFCSQFLKPYQDLIEVNYFTAIQKSRGKQDRQDLFLSANKLNHKFNLFLGKYLEKEMNINGQLIKTYEEKETDVHIAVKMIRDVVFDRCDISVLISTDSDLIPPIDFIHEYKPNHKIFVYFPPARFSYDLKQKSTNIIYLQNHESKFLISQFPAELPLPNGYVLKRPNSWS